MSITNISDAVSLQRKQSKQSLSGRIQDSLWRGRQQQDCKKSEKMLVPDGEGGGFFLPITRDSNNPSHLKCDVNTCKYHAIHFKRSKTKFQASKLNPHFYLMLWKQRTFQKCFAFKKREWLCKFYFFILKLFMWSVSTLPGINDTKKDKITKKKKKKYKANWCICRDDD